MKAIIHQTYGSPDVLELREVDQPTPAADELLVRVHAASANPADWHTLTGTPYVARAKFGLRKPKSDRLGIDFAGTVEAVGSKVTRFQPGDEVFGGTDGAFAEYVCVAEDRGVAPKPSNVTFEEAAAAPVAAITALQGLCNKGGVQPGQSVLINGASGGVGTFAVQIAKAFGAQVTGVCSTGNVDIVRSIGADHVVDYTTDDFTRIEERYDLMLDIAGSRSWAECRRVLDPGATYVIVGGPKRNRWIASMGRSLAVRLAALRSTQKVVVFWIAKLTSSDMADLGELLESGKVKPVIDRRYELSEIADAFRYLGEGHARGKIVVSVA
jgi:NADPH:quinone reductase-like Zn-dependent oxidoreductase